MEEKLIELVKRLKEKHKKIASMESCTGGGFANAITNISGSSEVFEFGAVTYSNDYKIKMGVSKETIEKFTVYSNETAQGMAKAICDFTGADFGVGITGKLKRFDPNNLTGEDDKVYVCIFDLLKNEFFSNEIYVPFDTRSQNKEFVIEFIVDKLLKML